MHEHAIRRLTLTAVAGHGIAVVEMGMLVDLERDGSPGIEAHAHIAAGVDPLDGPQLAIRDTLLPVRRGELHAVAHREGAVGFAIERDALEPARIVGDALAALARDREEILRGVDVRDPRVLAGGNAVASRCPWCSARRRRVRTARPIADRRR